VEGEAGREAVALAQSKRTASRHGGQAESRPYKFKDNVGAFFECEVMPQEKGGEVRGTAAVDWDLW
jgi:hypothetical protein